MEEVIEFLNKNPWGFLSTVDNGRPRVRPFGFMCREKGRYYFCTSTQKDVYRQMKDVPFIEFSCSTPEFSWLRLSGGISFTDDIQIKEKIIREQDLVRSIYKTADNPVFSVFYLEHGEASLTDFSGSPSKNFTF
ncbi:MAG: pyridoxamine 5'-phosphate oxidase family protein [Spirochaetota bacterium]